MTSTTPVVLATQSIQRQELFATLEIPFQVEAADIDELAIDDPDDVIRAALVAKAKGEKIAALHPEAIIVSADTFVVLDGQRLEKPSDKTAAIEMLTQLSDHSFVSHTGWSYIDPTNAIQQKGTVTTGVTFRPLSSIEVEHYVQTQPVEKWAGGFSIVNAAGLALISDIQGSITGLMGLPIEALIPLLRSSGVL